MDWKAALQECATLVDREMPRVLGDLEPRNFSSTQGNHMDLAEQHRRRFNAQDHLTPNGQARRIGW